jgi:tetratricopeptide (TPR) repeat protein
MTLRTRAASLGFTLTLLAASPAFAQQSHSAAEFYTLPSDAAQTLATSAAASASVADARADTIVPVPASMRAFVHAAVGAPAWTSRGLSQHTSRGAQSTSSDEQRARQRFEAGVRYADSLQWAEAADAFEESYRLFPRPATLRNLGLAHRALGRYMRAIDELQRFLQEAHPDADVSAQVNQIITEMRGQLATVTIVPSVSGAQITLDNQAVHANEEIQTDPGNHVVAATASGYARSGQTFTLQRAEQRRIDLRLERAGGGILSQWWLWTIVGVVVAGGVAVAIVAASHEEMPNCGTLDVCISPQ